MAAHVQEDANPKVREGDMSLKKAVNEKCKECIYDPQSGQGTWREQVEKCTSLMCPLYPYRPTSRKAKPGEKGAQPEGLRRYREAQAEAM